jgi:uncharacterized membrane protein
MCVIEPGGLDGLDGVNLGGNRSKVPGSLHLNVPFVELVNNTEEIISGVVDCLLEYAQAGQAFRVDLEQDKKQQIRETIRNRWRW